MQTSCALIKGAQKEELRRKWLSTMQEKRGSEHLSRIKLDVSLATGFFVGTRQEQTILARLRFGSNNLNASKSRWFFNVSNLCECGEIETVRHYLLHCSRYDQSRSSMLNEIRTFWRGFINEEFLLGAATVKLDKTHWEKVVAAVATFVRSTKRDI